MQTLVSQHETAIHGDTLLFIAHTCGVGATANSDQNDISLKYLAVSQGDLSAVSVLLNLFEQGAGVELNTALLEGTLKHLNDGGVFVRNEVGQALNNGYIHAHCLPHGRELATDHAAAKHNSAVRQVIHLQCLSGSQHAPLNGQTKGLRNRARSEHNILTLVLRAVHGNGVFAGELTLTVNNLNTLHLQQAGETLELAPNDAVLVVANLTHLNGL